MAMNGMGLEYSWHALHMMALRDIPQEWVERTVARATLRTADAGDSELERFFGPIPEFGERVLRVVVNTKVTPWHVVSVFFDRSMRGRL